MQRTVQAAIDIAGHIVADEGLSLPKSRGDSIDLQVGSKIITPGLRKKIKNMLGFQTIAVHEDQNLDPGILQIILTQHLKDLEACYRTILK